MAKLRVSSNTIVSSSTKKKHATVSLRVVMNMLQRSLSLTKNSPSLKHQYEEAEVRDSECVPHDVEEGHFAVIAMDNQNEPKRFVIPLTCLNHPLFLTFLDQAAEEYGFNRQGALTLPCRPRELERFLSGQ
ncbi:hypothetical protein QQ045_004740 [Rhodiola kirilowii]